MQKIKLFPKLFLNSAQKEVYELTCFGVVFVLDVFCFLVYLFAQNAESQDKQKA